MLLRSFSCMVHIVQSHTVRQSFVNKIPVCKLLMASVTVCMSNNVYTIALFSVGEIDGNSSAFFYPDGKSHRNYQNNTFVPKFLEDVEESKVQNATEQCGEHNLACIFDLVFTDDTDVANQTKVLGISAENQTAEASKWNNNTIAYIQCCFLFCSLCSM